MSKCVQIRQVSRTVLVEDGRTILDAALDFGSSFPREKHAGPILCIAGGSGLAPIKSIVESALVLGMQQPIHVYFGARAERDLYLLDRFEALGARHPNLTFDPVLSEGSGQFPRRGGWVTDAAGCDSRDLDGWKAYVAGPPSMVEAALQITTARSLRPACRCVLHAHLTKRVLTFPLW